MLRLIENFLGRPRSAWEQQNHEQLKRRQTVMAYLRGEGEDVEGTIGLDYFVVNSAVCSWFDLVVYANELKTLGGSRHSLFDEAPLDFDYL
jgi:hypothetical protein